MYTIFTSLTPLTLTSMRNPGWVADAARPVYTVKKCCMTEEILLKNLIIQKEEKVASKMYVFNKR